MAIKNIGPETAKEILDKEDDAVYIDVRTEPEFLNGHVPKAVNIPVVWPDATRQMKPNPDFVKVVQHISRKASGSSSDVKREAALNLPQNCWPKTDSKMSPTCRADSAAHAIRWGA